MGLFVKNVRAIVGTSTTTTTTSTSTTTTTLPIVDITDDNVYIGGIISVDTVSDGEGFVYTYNNESPVFSEFSKSTGGLVGDVQMDVVTNNTTLLDNQNGTYTLDVDIVLTYQNTGITNYASVQLPRLAIDLPVGGFKSTTSTFGHGSSVSQLRLYTPKRVVMEFSNLSIPPSQSRSFTIQGVAVLSINTTQPEISYINIQPYAFNAPEIGVESEIDIFEFQLNATPSVIPTLGFPIDVKTIYRTDVSNDTIVVGSSSTSVIYRFTPVSFQEIGTNYAGTVIRVEDSNNPRTLVDHEFKKGFAEINGTVSTTTTTTTTIPSTTIPDSATMSFKTSGFPQSTSEGIYTEGEGMQFVVQVDNTTFDPVPYRVVISSPDYPSDIGVQYVVGGLLSVLAFDGDVVEDDTLLSGVVSSPFIGSFINNGTVSGSLIFQLYVDAANNGAYVLQDTLTYQVNSEGGEIG